MLSRLHPDKTYCDKVIWNSFKNGDKDAFATLYYRYFGILIQNCFRYSKDLHLIEDCIHDLFVEIWHNKRNLATPDSVGAYLLCSTQRKIIRQIKKSRSITQSNEGLLLPDSIHSIEEKIIADQTRADRKQIVAAALNKLTKRQKEAVCFRYYDNLSYAEISGRMAISTDAVYNLVSKALDTIQKYLPVKSNHNSPCLN
jgi:RNA polymerase sigma factor (sigma-70 family)